MKFTRESIIDTFAVWLAVHAIDKGIFNPENYQGPLGLIISSAISLGFFILMSKMFNTELFPLKEEK